MREAQCKWSLFRKPESIFGGYQGHNIAIHVLKKGRTVLVFLSDIHWTDGTSGETIHSGAFRGFVQDLSRMARNAKARDLEVVLLGDIFDLIRSEQWIKEKVRPWDAKSPKQEQNTKTILQGILRSGGMFIVCFYRPKENSNDFLKCGMER